MLPPVTSYDVLACPLPLRRHQAEALAAVERARAAGSTRWWVTMPPGAGKTLVGTEVARVLGRRTVVLSPNTAIQGQWARTWDAYDGPHAGTRRDLRTPFTSLTYQALAVFDDEAEADPGSHVGRLHPNGQALVETLREAGPLLLVLDECHHLLEVWGELIREVLDGLPEACVLGLTATPPAAMTRSQQELTEALFGLVLHESRIPALVKEGTLAPYAELVWAVQPTAEEASWLGEQSTRFAELTSDLFAPGFGSTGFAEWTTTRFVDGEWAETAAREPELADAALRLVHADLLALPTGATLHEQHRRPLSAEDWRLLLDDWLLRCVLPRSEEHPEDRRVLEAVRRVLPSIGYVWTKKGIRTGRGTVDRVTARSAAKQQAVAGILTAEHANLGERLRALVLCDHERAGATTSRRLADDDTTPPEPAGSAVGVLAGLLRDPSTAALAPLLVTGTTVAASAQTLERLVEHVDRTHPGLAASLRVEHDGEVPVLTGRWTAGQWVQHATAFFTEGGTQALIGTRGLLGEGWDAPSTTTLVDLTTATTPTAVVQTRGRALRTDPSWPDKVALVWTVVCVFEGHVAGANDWERLARKHRGYFTVDERGAVVDGLAGVDSALNDYRPPPVAELDALDARMLVRSEDRDRVRQGWLAQTAYADRVEHVVRVRDDLPATAPPPAPAAGTTGLVPWTEASAERPGARLAAAPGLLALLLVVGVVLGLSPWWLLLVAPLAVLAAALLGRSRVLAASRHTATPGLVAAAVADGLHRAGLSPAGADALAVDVLPDGGTAYRLTGVPEEVSATFAAALEEALSPMSGPRYVLARTTTSPPRGLDGLRRGLAALVHPVPDGEVWHTVPAVLAKDRTRADAFADAWDHWLGGGRPLLASSPGGAGVLATTRGQDPFSVTCVIRREWR